MGMFDDFGGGEQKRTTTPTEFVERYGAEADRAAKELGVSRDIILGQWGLETGWGKSIIPGTNNLGNIKDFRKDNNGVTATDNANGSVDKYRKFETLGEGTDHFTGLIQRKYKGAIGSGDDPTKYATALKVGGYAEDPRYVDKINIATDMVRKVSNQNPAVALVERGVNAIIPSAQAAEVGGTEPTKRKGMFNDFADEPTTKSTWERTKAGAVDAVKSAVKSVVDGHLGVASGFADGGNVILNGVIDGGSALIPEQRNLTSLVTGQEPRNVVQRWNDERNANLDAFNKENKSTLFDVGRVAGNVGFTWPVGGVVGAGIKGAAALPGMARVAPALTALGDAAITGGAVPTNFASNAAGAATRLAGGALTGGASAALVNPDDAATGAVFGAVGGPAFAGMGRMISPMVRPAIQKFQSEGITPTLGQLIGTGAAKGEEKLTSLPFVGPAIQRARERVFSEVNDAAFNRALNPIGEKLPKNLKGHEAVDYVKEKLSEKYNDLLPRLKFNADAEFSKGLDAARANLKSLAMYPEKALARFDEFVDATITSKLDPNGFMDGHTLQRSKEEIERLIRSYKPSQSGDEQRIAGALGDLDKQIRESLTRTNPKHGIELRQLDTGYANYIRVEAAAYKSANGGVATPAHLDAAVKATDKSLRHTEASRGKALMQDLSSPAREFLGNKVPDSGTAGRAALGVGGLGALYIDPASGLLGLGGGVLASGLYTDTGRKAVAALMTQRPAIAGLLSQGVRGFAPHTGGLLNTDELFQP